MYLYISEILTRYEHGNENMIGKIRKGVPVSVWNYAPFWEFVFICCHQKAAHGVLFLFLSTLLCFAFPTPKAVFNDVPAPLLCHSLLLWEQWGASGTTALDGVQAVSMPLPAPGHPSGLAHPPDTVLHIALALPLADIWFAGDGVWYPETRTGGCPSFLTKQKLCQLQPHCQLSLSDAVFKENHSAVALFIRSVSLLHYVCHLEWSKRLYGFIGLYWHFQTKLWLIFCLELGNAHSFCKWSLVSGWEDLTSECFAVSTSRSLWRIWGKWMWRWRGEIFLCPRWHSLRGPNKG